MKISMTLALPALIAALAAPSRSQEAPAPAPGKKCITVELMMYSGRPRPQYQICDENRKRDALSRLKETDQPANQMDSIPGMQSTPAYQGVLITLPDGESTTSMLVGRGFARHGNRKFKDRDRGLERYFLDQGAEELDLSRSPTEGKPLKPTISQIQTDIQNGSH
jgi:hypothetical protein